MNSALKWYRRQQFNPSVLGAAVNPFYLARRALWREIAACAPELHGRLLDVGCGRKPYRALFSVDEYIGLEFDSPATRSRGYADCYYDGKKFPFDDATFDVVLCNQVLEHVFNPGDFMAEINRVLRSGGKLLLTVPFVWDEHEQPHDYARYSSFGLAHLLREHDFHLERQCKTLANISVIAQMLNAYLFKTLRTRSTAINAVVTTVVMAPVSIAGMAMGRLLPGNNDLFLDSVVLAKKRS